MTNHLLAHDHSDLDEALAATLTAMNTEDLEGSFHHLDVFFARLAMHIRAENVHLFPTLKAAAGKSAKPNTVPSEATVQAAIRCLIDDHDFFMSELAAAVKELRDFRRGKTADLKAADVIESARKRLTEVSKRLETHNDLEETQVYHWAAAMLDPEEQETLSKNIQAELENLPPRLRTE